MMAALLVCGMVPAEQFTGRVLAVVDGDMLSVIRDDVAEFVHLYGVDCPEPAQAFGPEAKAFVSELVLGTSVVVQLVNPNEEAVVNAPASQALVAKRWLATVGEPGADPEEMLKQDEAGALYANVVLEDGRVLNHVLVAEGMAWWYPLVAPNDILLKRLNADAMEAHVGLWVDPAPLAPWDFRKRQEAEEATPELPGSTPAAAPADENGQETVFITKNGAHFHKYGCRHLDKTQKVLTRAEAESRGYDPCALCFPETLLEKEVLEAQLQGDASHAQEAAATAGPASRPAVPRGLQAGASRAGANQGDLIQVPVPEAMELMARHRPRLYRDSSGAVAGVTADAISQIPYAGMVGLRDGDVISSVNGVPIDSMATVFDLGTRFQNQRHFDVVVLRNGQPQTLRIDVP